MVSPIQLPMNRVSLLHLIKAYRPAINIAVEVGILKGQYSRYICNILRPEKFYGIDPFKLYEGYTDKPSIDFQSQEALDILANKMAELIPSINKPKQSVFLKKTSIEAASEFLDCSVDFIFIDGDHQYNSVKQDIEVWYNKITPDGVFCGHDYAEGSSVEKFGVIDAVQEFVQQHKLRFAVTNDKYKSWIVCKDNNNIFF